jgi:hypothetical protein
MRTTRTAKLNGAHDAYLQAAFRAEGERVRTAQKGERNNTLFASTAALGSLVHCGLDEQSIITEMTEASSINGAVEDDGLTAVSNTIKSGLAAGMSNPRDIPDTGSHKQAGRILNFPPRQTHVAALPGNASAVAPVPAWTPPGVDAKPIFHDWPEPPRFADELRRHAYQAGARPDGEVVLIKVKKTDGNWQCWYRVINDKGVPGWQAEKPAGYLAVPYTGGMDLCDPEFTCDPIYWTEGERDTDTIVKLGLLGFTFGGASSVPENCEQWVMGRPVVILADNDIAGRKHAEAKAALCASISASVKIVHFDDTEPGGDVTSWLAGHSRDELLARIDAMPAWQPLSPESKTAGASDLDEEALYTELAELPPVQYAKRRAAVANELGIPMGFLDDEIKTRRQRAGLARNDQEHLFEWWAVEPWPEPVDGDPLIRTLVERVRRHVVMGPEQALAVALWIMMTWVHEQAAIHSPILMVTSAEANSGKSTLLGVITFLARKSLPTVEISAAAVFRSIEMCQPTFIIDEADTTFQDNDALRSVVNSGWTRGQGVVRCDPDTHEPRRFSTFCPKAIGLKGKKLPDTTASRAIVIEMKRKLHNETAQDFQHIDDADLATLRRKLSRWAGDNAARLTAMSPALPEGFVNRVAANWRLLLAIADLAGGDWPDKARKAAKSVAEVKATLDASIGTELLNDIRAAFAKSGKEGLFSRRLSELLTTDPERPWAEYRNGRPLTQKQLGNLLAGYKITSETIWDGKVSAKGYQLSRFDDAFARYLPQEVDFEATKRQSADRTTSSDDSRSDREEAPDGSENDSLSNNEAGSDALTDRKPESGAGRMNGRLSTLGPPALGPPGDSLDDFDDWR